MAAIDRESSHSLLRFMDRSPAASARCRRPDHSSDTAAKSTYGIVCCPSKCVLPGHLRSQRGRNWATCRASGSERKMGDL